MRSTTCAARAVLAATIVIGLVAGCGGPGRTAATVQTDGREQAALGSVDEFQVGLDELGERSALPGAALYARHCAGCHAGGVARAPHFTWLEMMPAAALMGAMQGGIMKTQAAALSPAERVQVVEYLTRRRYDPHPVDRLAAAVCGPEVGPQDVGRPPAAVGWGHDNTRYVPAAVAGLTAADAADLDLAWAFVFPDAMRARSQPAIGFGSVYVGSQDGHVYALDIDSGCIRWRFQASAEVRTGIVLAQTGGRSLAFFGDILARAYAVDAITGEQVWVVKADDHPSATLTASPAVHDGTLYVPVSSLEVTAAADPTYDCCTFRGNVVALDALTGAERWRSYAIEQAPRPVRTTSTGATVYAPSGAPIWASPTVDAARGRLYVGTGENYSSPADGNSDAVLALDLATGKRIWTRQITSNDAWNVACMMAGNPNCPAEDGPDYDLGSSLMLVDAQGKQLLVGGHKMGAAFALDPDVDAPRPIWWTRVGRGSIQGGVHFGMAAQGSTVYVPINDMNDTRNGDVLDPAAARPGVHAVNASNGAVLWSAVASDTCGDDRPFCDPGVSAALTAIDGAVIAGHLDGKVRIHDRADGHVLWQFDSAREFTGVGGLTGRGGSMSGAGPAVGDGYLVVNSGYGLYFHEPGNVLLAFRAR